MANEQPGGGEDEPGTVEVEPKGEQARVDLVTRVSDSGSVALYLYVLDEHGNQLIEHTLSLEEAEMLARRAADAVEVLQRGAVER